MREFKFRVWDKDKKIFVTDKSLLIPYVGIRISPEGGLYHFNELKTNWVLQQYTGLKDKNEVEIYEGDVLLLPRYGALSDSFLTVSYETNLSCCNNNGIVGLSIPDEPNLCTIIGNILENPELI